MSVPLKPTHPPEPTTPHGAGGLRALQEGTEPGQETHWCTLFAMDSVELNSGEKKLFYFALLIFFFSCRNRCFRRAPCGWVGDSLQWVTQNLAVTHPPREVWERENTQLQPPFFSVSPSPFSDRSPGSVAVLAPLDHEQMPMEAAGMHGCWLAHVCTAGPGSAFASPPHWPRGRCSSPSDSQGTWAWAFNSVGKTSYLLLLRLFAGWGLLGWISSVWKEKDLGKKAVLNYENCPGFDI